MTGHTEPRDQVGMGILSATGKKSGCSDDQHLYKLYQHASLRLHMHHQCDCFMGEACPAHKRFRDYLVVTVDFVHTCYAPVNANRSSMPIILQKAYNLDSNHTHDTD